MAKQKAKRSVYAMGRETEMAKRDVGAMGRDVGTTEREADEAERMAERAVGQGIVREKEAGVRLRCGTGRRRLRLRFCALREHISFISYFSFGGMRISRAVVGRF